jgi:hypothetical protein
MRFAPFHTFFHLKTKARKIGANGIILDKSQPIKSGIISTGIWVEARAIRLKNGNRTKKSTINERNLCTICRRTDNVITLQHNGPGIAHPLSATFRRTGKS